MIGIPDDNKRFRISYDLTFNAGGKRLTTKKIKTISAANSSCAFAVLRQEIFITMAKQKPTIKITSCNEVEQ